jgi:hypothetical protein
MFKKTQPLQERPDTPTYKRKDDASTNPTVRVTNVKKTNEDGGKGAAKAVPLDHAS